MAALAAYRHLWRATKVAFEGDARVLNAARQQIRENFRENKVLAPSGPETETAIKHAEEVATFLRANVVQGKKDGDTYKLRIHEDTERGDNDTIKLGNGQTVKIDGKTCKDR